MLRREYLAAAKQISPVPIFDLFFIFFGILKRASYLKERFLYLYIGPL